MFLSIIVPMYNVEKYLDNCINSLLQQDIDDYEIILIDDKSTDKTLEIAKKRAIESHKIMIIEKASNTGLSDTRNRGILVANGDYLMFIDSDDYIDCNCVKDIKNIITEYNPDIIYFGSINEYDDGSSLVQYMYKSQKDKLYDAKQFMYNELSRRNLSIPACFATYKKSLITNNDILFKVGLLHEDIQWSPQILYRANTVYTLGRPLYHYLVRAGSISHSRSRKKHGTDQIKTCNFLMKFANEIVEDNISKYMKNYIAMTYMKAVTTCELYRHKDVKIDRTFPLKNAITFIDTIKAVLFCLNPRLYAFVYRCCKG